MSSYEPYKKYVSVWHNIVDIKIYTVGFWLFHFQDFISLVQLNDLGLGKGLGVTFHLFQLAV